MGAAVVRWASRHPVAALGAVFVFLPLQQTVLALAYRYGAPFVVVRGAGLFKEAIIAGLLLAVMSDPKARRTPLTIPDKTAVALVALVTVYLIVPFVFPGALGGQPLDARLSAWRVNVLFVLLFFVARRLPWSGADIRVLENCLLAAGALLAVGGLWQMADSASYDRFMTDVVQQPRFVRDVLGVVGVRQETVLFYGAAAGTGFVRVGGWLINPLTLGFVLVVPLAVAIRRMTCDRRSLAVTLTAAGCGAVLVGTLTRSAIVAGILAGTVTCWGALRARYRRAVGVLLIVGMAALVVTPFLPGSNLATRLVGAVTGGDVSAKAHADSSSAALELALQHPAGLGLGANPQTGMQFAASNSVTAENGYLQVALEIGWIGLALFVAVTVAMLVELYRRPRGEGGGGGLAALAAGCGLAVGALFLHVWVDLPTSLLFWGFAGAVSSRYPSSGTPPPQPMAARQPRSPSLITTPTSAAARRADPPYGPN